MKRAVLAVGFVLGGVLWLAGATVALADSAGVLPKGVSSISLKLDYYPDMDQRYDPDGDKEDVDVDYNAVLGSNVFPGIIPDGFNIGTTVVDFDYQITEAAFRYFYGLTDRLSLGLEIPYGWKKTDLKEARVDTSGANLGINPAALTDPSQPPLIPISMGGIASDEIATEFVLNALETVLGYEPFDDWSDSNIMDIKLGGRYQYLRNDDWQLAVTGGVHVPTGQVNNPDNLLDLGFGRGAWALFVGVNNDYTGIKNLVLDATVEYTLVLPDEEVQRVLADVNRPIVPAQFKEKVDRDLGDEISLKLSADYSLSEAFKAGVQYQYTNKFKDSVDGSNFPEAAYESLEDETDWHYQLFQVRGAYSTLPLFKEKKFPLPVDLLLLYEKVFDGSNNLFDQHMFRVELTTYYARK